ncbi:phosphatase PAP2 family protein [Sphingobacterium faecale]|uniref:Phosphatase PAP2 family protein n=1 Tax=Sphingobacterium faecale TaxID=2803775 RepID=A0ABS1QYI3_9SPHI|nr:phosphatase PAP2 family protein [Sphingobacterium faecale]MBL1407492.1 phosphatase PAP2 family protein [Sphingobacterium faecale]
MKRTVLLFITLFNVEFLMAQALVPSDSLPESHPMVEIDSIKPVGQSFMQKELAKRSVAPILLFSAAATTWGTREHIRDIRNRYLPTFKARYDDYLQYGPAAAVYALKFAGIKGRNNTGRATLSYATSLVIMGVLVNSIKYTTRVQRPEGTKKNSFPSGHTAMAFTNAGFLDKEYGLVNPAYRIAGYGSAALTGLGRNLNNRHWLPDVLAGAGVGILSNELGYFFIDKFYKNKGDNLGLLSRVEGNDNPSFLSLKVGTALATTNFFERSGLDDRKQKGFEAGFEGAYFFSKKWGIGGDIGFASFPVTPLRDDWLNFDEEPHEYSIETQSMGFLSIGLGPYYSYELSDRFLITLKATGGYTATSSGKVFIKYKDDGDNGQMIDVQEEVARYKPKPAFRWNTGAAFTYKLNRELGITAYSNYNQIKSKIRYNFADGVEVDEHFNDGLNSFTVQEKINYFTLGLRLTAFF